MPRRNDYNRFCRSNLRSVAPSRNVWEAITTVRAAPDLDSLCALMCPVLALAPNSQRNHKVNYCLLVGTKEGDTHRRIEFRQHHGSVDGDEISRWVCLMQRYLYHCAEARPLAENDVVNLRAAEELFWGVIADLPLEAYYKKKTTSFPAVHSITYVSREALMVPTSMLGVVPPEGAAPPLHDHAHELRVAEAQRVLHAPPPAVPPESQRHTLIGVTPAPTGNAAATPAAAAAADSSSDSSISFNAMTAVPLIRSIRPAGTANPMDAAIALHGGSVDFFAPVSFCLYVTTPMPTNPTGVRLLLSGTLEELVRNIGRSQWTALTATSTTSVVSPVLHDTSGLESFPKCVPAVSGATVFIHLPYTTLTENIELCRCMCVASEAWFKVCEQAPPSSLDGAVLSRNLSACTTMEDVCAIMGQWGGIVDVSSLAIHAAGNVSRTFAIHLSGSNARDLSVWSRRTVLLLGRATDIFTLSSTAAIEQLLMTL